MTQDEQHASNATDDYIWQFCTKCNEEYLLPEDSDQCPICSNHTLEEV